MARPKLGEGDTQRLQLKISDEELKAIDDWRFANRVESRSEAVRRLCQIGLQVDINISRLEGIMDEAEKSLAEDAQDIIKGAGAAPSKEQMQTFFMTLIKAYMRSNDFVHDISQTIRDSFQKATTFREPGQMNELLNRADELEEAFSKFRVLIEKGRAKKEVHK
ncbi:MULTISPECIES: hypothetical protein [unclassified Aureimonas]|uniref:hypothetical protein n=1 Tax=unclassified Aureimonas TaxID=2615206 RepID=UPI0006F8DC21|nr:MULTISPECIES: hypothetical protein [unclassified Aureimonas]KQT60380.1 hypothetical protein ASG62_06900 [Aureimonas sp. Leaf427]KQT79258.1 hypothetical protein ASG54_09500 [Aureimonas sp. Leaf460]